MEKNLILELKSFDRNTFDKQAWLDTWASIPDGVQYMNAHKKVAYGNTKVNFLDPESQSNCEKLFLFVPKIDGDKSDDAEIFHANSDVDTSEVRFDEKDVNEMREIVKVINMENFPAPKHNEENNTFSSVMLDAFNKKGIINHEQMWNALKKDLIGLSDTQNNKNEYIFPVDAVLEYMNSIENNYLNDTKDLETVIHELENEGGPVV